MITPWFLEGAEFAEQQKIPAFGWGISRGFCESKFAFSFSGCLTPAPPIKIASNTWGGLIDEYFQSQGEQQGAEGKTAAVLAEDNDSGKSGVKVIAATAKAVDMEVVYEKATLPAAEGGTPVSDFSPYINDIMTSNDGEQPDVVFAVISQNNLIPFAPALDAAGFDGLQTNAVLYSPQAAGIVNGDFVLTQFATPEAAADTPGVQTFVDAVEAVAAPDEVINQPTIAGYLSADMFIQAVKKAGKNPTPASIQKAAAKLTYQIKGFVGPTKYPKGFKAGTPCGQLAESDGTDWSSRDPVPVLHQHQRQHAEAHQVLAHDGDASTAAGGPPRPSHSVLSAREVAEAVQRFFNLVVSGAVTGAIYSMMAAGLVLTYQTSGIFNFAHGAIAFTVGYFYFQLNTGEGLGWVPSLDPLGARVRPAARTAARPDPAASSRRRTRVRAHRRDDRSPRRVAGARAMAGRERRRRRVRPRAPFGRRHAGRGQRTRASGPSPREVYHVFDIVLDSDKLAVFVAAALSAVAALGRAATDAGRARDACGRRPARPRGPSRHQRRRARRRSLGSSRWSSRASAVSSSRRCSSSATSCSRSSCSGRSPRSRSASCGRSPGRSSAGCSSASW